MDITALQHMNKCEYVHDITTDTQQSHHSILFAVTIVHSEHEPVTKNK